jgi:hypothetical protein
MIKAVTSATLRRGLEAHTAMEWKAFSRKAVPSSKRTSTA